MISVDFMYWNLYGKRPLVENSQMVSAGVCVRNFLLNYNQNKESRKFDLNNEEDINNVARKIESEAVVNMRRRGVEGEECTDPNNVKMRLN